MKSILFALAISLLALAGTEMIKSTESTFCTVELSCGDEYYPGYQHNYNDQN